MHIQMLWEHATRRQDGIGTSLPSVSLAKLPEAKLYHLIIANIQNNIFNRSSSGRFLIRTSYSCYWSYHRYISPISLPSSRAEVQGVLPHCSPDRKSMAFPQFPQFPQSGSRFLKHWKCLYRDLWPMVKPRLFQSANMDVDVHKSHAQKWISQKKIIICPTVP